MSNKCTCGGEDLTNKNQVNQGEHCTCNVNLEPFNIVDYETPKMVNSLPKCPCKQVYGPPPNKFKPKRPLDNLTKEEIDRIKKAVEKNRESKNSKGLKEFFENMTQAEKDELKEKIIKGKKQVKKEFDPKTKKVSTADLLQQSADLFRTKNKEHGDAYYKVGQMLHVLYPDGLTLNSLEDFTIIGTLVQILFKLARTSNTCFGDKDLVYDSRTDSPTDSSVYNMMLVEIMMFFNQLREEGKI